MHYLNNFNRFKIKDVKNALSTLSDVLSELEAEHPDMELYFEYEMLNTGLVPKIQEGPPMWQEFEDLGGRSYSFKIQVPNHKQPEIARDEENKEEE